MRSSRRNTEAVSGARGRPVLGHVRPPGGRGCQSSRQAPRLNRFLESGASRRRRGERDRPTRPPWPVWPPAIGEVRVRVGLAVDRVGQALSCTSHGARRGSEGPSGSPVSASSVPVIENDHTGLPWSLTEIFTCLDLDRASESVVRPVHGTPCFAATWTSGLTACRGTYLNSRYEDRPLPYGRRPGLRLPRHGATN